MPRSRNIKPAFFANDALAECDPLARLLFAGLWCLADRNGVLPNRPRRIKAELLPYDGCDIDDLLRQLAGSGFIVEFETDGEAYYFIPTFGRHQKPHPNEKAQHPEPVLDTINRDLSRASNTKSRAIGNKQLSDPADRGMLNDDCGKMKEDSGGPAKTRSRKSSFNPSSVDLPFSSDAFRESWAEWIKHRREIKKPLTETSVKQQLTKLDAMGESQAMRTLAHTIEKGWVGLREPDDAKKKGGRHVSTADSQRGTI